MEAVGQRLGSSWMERHGIKFRAMKTANDWHDLRCEVCSKVRGQDCLLWTGNVEDHIQSKKHENAVGWSMQPWPPSPKGERVGDRHDRGWS